MTGAPKFKKIKWQISDVLEKRGRWIFVLCKCECGTEKFINKNQLFYNTNGCLKCSETNKTHGKSTTRIYNLWANMRNRCNNKRAANYKLYGGRGIKVCKEWNSSFDEFYTWAMANGYTSNLSIDRINPDGNYEPTNCRWATPAEQNRNTRKNVWVDLNGKKMVLKDAAKMLGMSASTISKRMKKGMTFQEAIRKQTEMRLEK